MSDKEGVVRFQYNNKNVIIFNPDYHVVKKTINNMNEGVENPKYSFNGQRLHMIAREVLDKDFGGVPHSTMNKSGHFIFILNSSEIVNLTVGSVCQKVKIFMLLIIINIIHHV